MREAIEPDKLFTEGQKAELRLGMLLLGCTQNSYDEGNEYNLRADSLCYFWEVKDKSIYLNDDHVAIHVVDGEVLNLFDVKEVLDLVSKL